MSIGPSQCNCFTLLPSNLSLCTPFFFFFFKWQIYLINSPAHFIPPHIHYLLAVACHGSCANEGQAGQTGNESVMASCSLGRSSPTSLLMTPVCLTSCQT